MKKPSTQTKEIIMDFIKLVLDKILLLEKELGKDECYYVWSVVVPNIVAFGMVRFNLKEEYMSEIAKRAKKCVEANDLFFSENGTAH